jgi:hypothetical protein
MDSCMLSVLLYPYPHQYRAMFLSILILLAIGLPAYGLYRLIIWKMNDGALKVFHKILIITGISLGALFFAEISVTLITIHHVNKQLGFSTATPDTPEGELFEVSKVIPEKIMDRAGLMVGDRIQMNAVNDLYIHLINNQGKEVSFFIKRDKKEMEVRLKVPELDVPLADISFLF